MAKNDKTNVARILDLKGISYQIQSFEIGDNHKSAEDVAISLGISPEKIFKTLVLKGDNQPYLVAVIPSAAHLNLKRLARVSGNKAVEMLPMKDLEHVTGYIRGGCSPVGMKKSFPTYIDELAMVEETIFVSAGRRGHLLLISVNDLSALINAAYADISDFESLG